MEQMVRALGRKAPVGLLRGSPDENFLSWFNRTDHDQFGSCGGITSVSWIAGRIAQLWHHGRVKVIPVETQCFLELTAITLSMSWPAAGIAAMDNVVDLIDLHSSRKPLFFVPVECIIHMVIPGLQIESWIERHCGNCPNVPWDSEIAFCREVCSESTRHLSQALETMEVHIVDDTLKAHPVTIHIGVRGGALAHLQDAKL